MTAHTYIRCVNKIYVGDAADQWRLLHDFGTEQRAKRWQRDQEKNRPGSVTVGAPPEKVVLRALDEQERQHLARQREIRRLAWEQARDAARTPSPRPRPQAHSLSGKTAKLASQHVVSDSDTSSVRGRPRKWQAPRGTKNAARP